MYSNIGNKIKVLAKISFLFNTVLSIFLAFLFFAIEFIVVGTVTLILGPIIAWISSWLLYGFGEIVSLLNSINCKLDNTNKESEISEEESFVMFSNTKH